jgi:hypothetical protein
MAIIPNDDIEPLFLYYYFLKTDLAQFVGNEVVPEKCCNAHKLAIN